MTSRIDDNMIVTGSFSAGSYLNFGRSGLQSDLIYQPIDLTTARVHDAFQTLLPASPGTDDLGLVGGAFATDVPSIQTGDVKALGATPRYARFLIRLPAEYQTGQPVVIRALAGMKTTIADVTATIDMEAYRSGGDSLVDGTDLVQTSAITINDLTPANKDFTINPAALEAGDLIDLRVTIAVNDGATATSVIGILTNLFLGATVKG